MLIENRTTWKADHVRAIVEAAVKVTGYDKPIERLVVRRSRYQHIWIAASTLVLRIPHPDATPLEVLSLNRNLSARHYRKLICELVSAMVPYDDTVADYDLRLSTRNTTIRSILGLEGVSDRYDALNREEADSFEIPAWAELPLSAGERGKPRTAERVETLRAQLLGKELAQRNMLAEHARLLRISEMEIQDARDKLAAAEAKLNAPKKRRGKKPSEPALAG